MDQEQLVAVGGVLAILIGVIVYNNARSARMRKQAAADPARPGLVGKFAVHNGAVVGRVVAVEGGRLIVEQAGTRRSVPVSAAKEQGHDVVLSAAPEA